MEDELITTTTTTTNPEQEIYAKSLVEINFERSEDVEQYYVIKRTHYLDTVDELQIGISSRACFSYQNFKT